MKKALIILVSTFLASISISAQSTLVEDDFEGNGTITTWAGDDCLINTNYSNPFVQGINTSSTVLKYEDIGGQYANVRFDVGSNFNLSSDQTFSIKIYVPSNGLSGNQNNQISLKLQDGTIGAPWSTQTEVIKNIILDQWQTVSFDFLNDSFINADISSLPPTQRGDFNRVVIQINGENNNDSVVSFIDDVEYDGSIGSSTVFNYLVWSDEFDVDGPVNSSNWFMQNQLPNGGSWYNGEVQHYTNRIDNAKVENGVLKIIAKKETYTDQGHTKQYTSARLNSKFAFQYGRVEVMAKLPSGVGTWPAIWTLGKNIVESGAYWDNQGFGTAAWPACGEIDIMEHWGTNQNFVQSATHTPSSYGGTVNHGGQTISTASSAFHLYTLEWTADELIFGVDGNIHYTYNPAIKDASTWPFDAEQYVLFNLAILPNIPPSFTNASLEIDYIRIYQESGQSIVNEDDIKTNVIAFPNPVTDELNIKFANANQKEILLNLYSISGKLLRTYSKSINGNLITLNNLGDLESGIYFFTFNIDGKMHHVKVIKN